jgi:hypothetical protein
MSKTTRNNDFIKKLQYHFILLLLIVAMAQSDFGRMIQMTLHQPPIDDYIPCFFMLVGFTLLIVLQKSKDSKTKPKCL